MADLDGIIELLKRLPPDKQEPVCQIIDALGKDAGIDVPTNYALPANNIGVWVTKMKMERNSPRTIEMYTYYASKFLSAYPKPSKLDIQSYLARRLEAGTSPAAVENMRKAFRSLFSFLYEEGLWHEDPTERIRRVKVPPTAAARAPHPKKCRRYSKRNASAKMTPTRW